MRINMNYQQPPPVESYAASPGYTGNPICDPSPSVDFVVGGIGAITLLSVLLNASGFCLGKGINPFCHPVSRGFSLGLNGLFLLGIAGTLGYRHLGGCKNL